MPGLVLDASVALAGVMPDEGGPAGTAALDLVGEAGALVPLTWRIEVMNALLTAERRKRIRPEVLRTALVLLDALPITPDLETWGRAWSDIALLARRFRLTAYDAAYLELAQRAGLPLATLDHELRRAAEKLGVQAIGS
jgi:predicted nucleic acid-binding protein